MKKLIIVTLMALVPTSAFALTPGEVASGIFEFILNQIDKNNNGQVNTNSKVILKSNNNRIILGRLFLDKSGNDVDTVNFPACGANSANKRVDRLRLKVDEAKAGIGQVRLTYQNGNSVNINVNDEFAKGENSSWVDLGANRCIRKIRVTGEAMGGNKVTYTAITFVGRLAN